MGMNGAMFQMIAHGISSAGMFFLVGVVYDRVHHRNLDEFGGLFARMPVYSGLAIGIFFAGLGLPGLCGFIGEVLVTLSVWNYSKALAVDRGLGGHPHGRVHPVGRSSGSTWGRSTRARTATPWCRHTPRKSPSPLRWSHWPSCWVSIQRVVFDPMTPSVDKTVDDLVAWTKRYRADHGFADGRCRQILSLRTSTGPIGIWPARGKQTGKENRRVRQSRHRRNRHADDRQPAAVPAGTGTLRHDRAGTAAAAFRPRRAGFPLWLDRGRRTCRGTVALSAQGLSRPALPKAGGEIFSRPGPRRLLDHLLPLLVLRFRSALLP